MASYSEEIAFYLAGDESDTLLELDDDPFGLGDESIPSVYDDVLIGLDDSALACLNDGSLDDVPAIGPAGEDVFFGLDEEHTLIDLDVGDAFTLIATQPAACLKLLVQEEQQQGAGTAVEALGSDGRGSSLRFWDMLIVDGSEPLTEMVTLRMNSHEPGTEPGSSGFTIVYPADCEEIANNRWAEFDFGFDDPPRMLSPFDETKCVGIAVPMGPSGRTPHYPEELSTTFDSGDVGEANSDEETPISNEETPYTVHNAPPSAEEIEQDRIKFEAKHPMLIQATHQMNAALGLHNVIPPLLPFHLPDWHGDPGVLIDNLEFHRAAQYGSTLYLKSLSFFNFAPKKEGGTPAKTLLLRFDAEDTISLRASFVDLSGFGSGNWSYIVIGAKSDEASQQGQPLLAIACPFHMVQVVGYKVATWWDRGRCRKNIRCDLNYSYGGIPIIASQHVEPSVWSPVVDSMAAGNCRVTYLVEDWCWPPDKLKLSTQSGT
ncbi:MAG: hypothetical protein M1839_002913 [Geoglossum umbratile]|nr:MAG: hypothetical protein M1839_002913 [Geoglossum umbratile]